MKRALAALFLAVAAASPAHAAWARFKIADFKSSARHPGIVELDDGRAVVLIETKNLHVIRRSASGWLHSTLPIDPAKMIYNFIGCDCRGDGKKRLYVSFRGSTNVWEIEPYGPSWTVNEILTHPGRPSAQNNTGPLAYGKSADGAPTLFVTHPDRQEISECRWKKKWSCAVTIRNEKIWGPMGHFYADPPAWKTKDLLFFEDTLMAREPDGWKPVPGVDVTGRPDVLLSRKKPRTFYMFGTKNVEITLDENLAVASRKELVQSPPSREVDPASTGLPVEPGMRMFRQAEPLRGQAVGVLRSTPSERIYQTWGGEVVESKEVDGTWSNSFIASFEGTQAYHVRAGDTRGDGMDRLYVLETPRPYISPSRLWELVYYPTKDVVEVPNPSLNGLSKKGGELLGDLLRAELGRHGGLSVLHEGSLAAAAAEKSGKRNTTAPFRILSSVDARGESFELTLRVVRTAGGAPLKELKAAATRAGLPDAALSLALRVSEDWPLWTAKP